MQPRAILHADMDAFYAAIEQRDDPALRGKPVVVGGSSARGVVSAASYEARAFGIHSAMPSLQARKLCPDAIFVRGRMSKSTRARAERIFEIFRRFTPAVEGISLDEAFLDLTGTERLFGPPRAHRGSSCASRCAPRPGSRCSVGIAPVKLVAKIASDLAKPDGLLVVPPGQVREFLAPLPVGRIWGVGPVTRGAARARGHRDDRRRSRAEPDAELRRLLGSFGPERRAARARRGRARGRALPRGEVLLRGEHLRRATSATRDVLERAIRAHAEAVARRLRHDGLRARGVRAQAEARAAASAAARFPILTRSRDAAPSRATTAHALALAGCALLARAALAEPVRLVGLAAERLEESEAEQPSLLAETARAARAPRSA